MLWSKIRAAARNFGGFALNLHCIYLKCSLQSNTKVPGSQCSLGEFPIHLSWLAGYVDTEVGLGVRITDISYHAPHQFLISRQFPAFDVLADEIT